MGAWVERKAHVNLGESYPEIDHWDPDSRTGVQVKVRTSTDSVSLARNIESDASKLAKANRTTALDGTTNRGHRFVLPAGSMKIRVLDVYVKETASKVLRDPRFINKVRAIQKTTGVFIRVIPVRRLR